MGDGSVDTIRLKESYKCEAAKRFHRRDAPASEAMAAFRAARLTACEDLSSPKKCLTDDDKELTDAATRDEDDAMAAVSLIPCKVVEPCTPEFEEVFAEATS